MVKESIDAKIERALKVRTFMVYEVDLSEKLMENSENHIELGLGEVPDLIQLNTVKAASLAGAIAAAKAVIIEDIRGYLKFEDAFEYDNAGSLRIEFAVEKLDETTASIGAGVYDIKNDSHDNYEFIVAIMEEEE